MKSLKTYNKNVFQPAERRVQKFYNFFSAGGGLTPIPSPLPTGLVLGKQNSVRCHQL